MTVETATTIDTLNASYPSSTDPKSEGDDHIRLIKTVLKATVVSGPASSTDNTLPRFDGTSGKLIQGSGVVVDDSNNLDVPGQITSSTRGATRGFVTPDWRMYNTSSGNALAWNNGSDRMTLDTSGNLGLGVTPTYKLDVATGSSGVVRFSGTGTDMFARFETSGGTNFLGYSGSALLMYAGGSERARIDSSGNLLVGSTSNTLSKVNAYATGGGGPASTPSNASMTLGASSTSGVLSAGVDASSGFYSWIQSRSGSAGETYYDLAIQPRGGNLLVGTTSRLSVEKFGVSVSAQSDQVHYLYASHASYDGTMQVLSCARAASASFNFSRYFAYGSEVFRIAGDGNVTNTNNSYGALSDLKLKENITDASPKLAKLMQVRIVNYTLKADPDKTKLIGVIAQELEQISPGLIEETPDYEEVTKTREVEVPEVPAVLDDEGNEVTPAIPASTRTEEYTERIPLGTVTKSVKYSVFVPMLIKGMQEQQAHIEAMQAQLDAQNEAMQLLAARLAALEAK